MNKYELISLAYQFVSFLLEKQKVAEQIDNIFLFGSIASKNFDEESDIDIFIDVKKPNKKVEENIRKELYLFSKSKYLEYWKLKGVKNEISIKIGQLNKWEKIKRSIISNGIVLYGKYASEPEKLKHFILIKIKTPKISRSKQVSLWRRLYGYSQKVGNKVYTTEGLISECDGKKLEKAVILIPIENSEKIFNFLDLKKINYENYEIWSDVF